MPKNNSLLLLLVVCLTLIGKSQERPLIFKGATFITISEGVITNGEMVVQNGKIVSIAPTSSRQLHLLPQ
jgi:hypothetical protein